jgi:hypothetical protein
MDRAAPSVDQPVAALTGQVAVAVAEPGQVRAVVGQRQVGTEVASGDAAGPIQIRLERLARAGGSITDRLFELALALQVELEVDWRELDLRLLERPGDPLQGRDVVRAVPLESLAAG